MAEVKFELENVQFSGNTLGFYTVFSYWKSLFLNATLNPTDHREAVFKKTVK